MNSPSRIRRVSLFLLAVVAAAGLGLLTLAGHAQNTASGQVFAEPPVPAPRDAASNLAMGITAPFTIAAVGDVMVKRVGAELEAPEFQTAFRILRDADVAVGNLEGNLADLDSFDGPLRGMMGDRRVAAGLKAIGFDLLSRANNHVFDSDREGMYSTMAQLDAAGIVHGGSGRSLEAARAAAYLDTPKGRIGFVGMHTPSNNNASATYRVGNTGGRPGINPLGYTVYYHVTPEQLAAIKAIRRATYTPPPGTTNASRLPDPATEPADRVQFLGVWYKVGTPGTRSYDMNAGDLREILRSIRNGKYLSEFMIATIHAHQGPITGQQWLFEDQTPDFLVDLAHQTIDHGADLFVGHGPHVLRGIEICKGKPIFYGLGEFYYQWQHMDASLMTASWQNPEMQGDSDVSTRAGQGLGANWRPVNFESVIAESRFEGGRLVELRLHPVSAAWDGPMSMLGMPRQAPPALAQKILTRVQTLSKPFGTIVAIEHNVGVIRIGS